MNGEFPRTHFLSFVLFVTFKVKTVQVTFTMEQNTCGEGRTPAAVRGTVDSAFRARATMDIAQGHVAGWNPDTLDANQDVRPSFFKTETCFPLFLFHFFYVD